MSEAKLIRKLFTASGSWVCPAGVKFVRVYSVLGSGGGGGGGGGAKGGTVGDTSGGGGGAGGSSGGATAIIELFMATTPNTSYTITIGAGGSAGSGGAGSTSRGTPGGTGTNGGAGGTNAFGSTTIGVSTSVTGGIGGQGATDITGGITYGNLSRAYGVHISGNAFTGSVAGSGGDGGSNLAQQQ